MDQILVTGAGVINSIASCGQQFAHALLEGRCGAKRVELFPCEGHRCKFAYEIPPAIGIFPRFNRADLLARLVVRRAIFEAGIMSPASRDQRIALVVQQDPGTATTNVLTMLPYANYSNLYVVSGDLANNISQEFGFSGPAIMVDHPGRAGGSGVGVACDLLRRGKANMVVVVGVHALSEETFASLSMLGMMAPDCCRPFCQTRKGLVLGEGAAALVLENERFCRDRGYEGAPYGKILGYAHARDSYGNNGHRSEGRGLLMAMLDALDEAGVDPGEVDYINANAAGTETGDRIEAQAVAKVFGEEAAVPISSIKGHIGHCLGAAEPMAALAALLAMQYRFIPANLNCLRPDKDLPRLNYIVDQSIRANPAIALSNTVVSGCSSCLVLSV